MKAYYFPPLQVTSKQTLIFHFTRPSPVMNKGQLSQELWDSMNNHDVHI